MPPPRRIVLGLASLMALGTALGTVMCRRPAPAAVPPPSPSSQAPPARSAQAAPGLQQVLIQGVPHEEQLPDFCGEACVAMWLHRLGHRGDQRWVFDQSGLDPREGRGVYAAELLEALRRAGFQTGAGWFPVPAGTGAAPRLDELFRELHADLLRGVPSIVCMRYDEAPDATEHFRLILGYEPATDEVLYHEPAQRDGAYRRMPRARFLSLWPLLDTKDPAAGGIAVRLRLEGTPTPGSGPAKARTAADYAQHVLALKRRLPAGFHVRVIPPFVVVGDGDEADVARSAEGTVRWAATQLKALYFPEDPDEILNIWLFKDDVSYRGHLKALFREVPSTPYGYYSPKHNALFMNIDTGGGTLVHEIVHPLIDKNFPEVPTWLNEGLGSLYEQCDERDGKIIGLTNWRLAGLQEAIRDGSVSSISALLAADRRAFYHKDHAAENYAQARYLLYYLQEQGLLLTYYQRFRAAYRSDPTGLATLLQVLGLRDKGELPAFQRRWESWVLALEFSP